MGAMRASFGGLDRVIDDAPRDSEEKEVNDHYERPMFTTRPMSTMEKMKIELKRRLETYYKVEDESELPSVAVAVLERNLADAHSDTDDELIEELRDRPLPQVHDRDFEADFDEMYETDEELTDLYNARQYVEKKMKDESFNMNDTKWDEEIKKATEKGQLSNMKECEDILEDMLHWDKLLPDEIKQKVEAKFNELGDMCERGELEPEQAFELFKEFEDKMVSECTELMEAEPLTVNELSEADNKSVELNDPPGEGPVLRWESRIVFAPGGDAWHPKNRKVKLSVTVKELGLSRHAFRRLREVVGKRYNSGKDELTIISERFDHREENRKDCLRTLYALVEDAMKADELANAARNAYVKGRLQANSQFMDRLKMKTQKLRQAA
uniref:Small ribosomal subunit protein mS35 mitochondrial conserved domain-containing protein n=1 Tax=Aegilops tauschii TaxID=37682 RepID=R7W6V1_AEGTA